MKITKEILEEAKNWYLEGNSIRKIGKLIFQKYKIKIGKETIRRCLKEVIRSNKRTLDDNIIVKCYLQGSSLSELARENRVSFYTIKKILIRNGIKLRNLEEAKNLVLPRYSKNSFNGTQNEKAYLIGISLGDLYIGKASKNIIRVSTSSTKEKFIGLLTKLFQRYGRIRCYKYGKVYAFIADLDNSFNFLLDARENKNIIRTFNENEFFSFLAGFFDAEGSLILVRNKKWWKFSLRVYNSDYEVLEMIREKLVNMGISCKLKLRWTAGTERVKDGKKIISRKDGYIIEVTNKKDIFKLLNNLNLQHEEKIAKKMFMLTNLLPLPKV